jgi:hypothetical protein
MSFGQPLEGPRLRQLVFGPSCAEIGQQRMHARESVQISSLGDPLISRGAPRVDLARRASAHARDGSNLALSTFMRTSSLIRLASAFAAVTVAPAHAEEITLVDRAGSVTETVVVVDASPQQIYDLVTDYELAQSPDRHESVASKPRLKHAGIQVARARARGRRAIR